MSALEVFLVLGRLQSASHVQYMIRVQVVTGPNLSWG